MKALDKRTLSPECLASMRINEVNRANRLLILIILALLTILLCTIVTNAFEADRLKARINVLENTKELK